MSVSCLPPELKTEAAAAVLGRTLTGKMCESFALLPRRKGPRTFGRPGYLYKTEHILRVKRWMDVVSMPVNTAVKIVAAELQNRI